jgi:hypothetical protein
MGRVKDCCKDMVFYRNNKENSGKKTIVHRKNVFLHQKKNED